jgi:hypothetical protein
MAQTGSKRKQKNPKPKSGKRQERRFTTSLAYMPAWVAVVGMFGCFALGSGVFGLWILDPPLGFASWLVAAGGFGLGVALWFGQPPETAVSVGDSGIGVESGKDTLRVQWYDLKALRITSGQMIVEGNRHTLKFSVSANQFAVAAALKEAAERVPSTIDVDKAIMKSLPESGQAGTLKDVEDDQVTGMRCAATKKAINLEEDARLCPCCGQVFHKDGVPEVCPSCENSLKSRTLSA